MVELGASIQEGRKYSTLQTSAGGVRKMDMVGGSPNVGCMGFPIASVRSQAYVCVKLGCEVARGVVCVNLMQGEEAAVSRWARFG